MAFETFVLWSEMGMGVREKKEQCQSEVKDEKETMNMCVRFTLYDVTVYLSDMHKNHLIIIVVQRHYCVRRNTKKKNHFIMDTRHESKIGWFYSEETYHW